MARIVIIDDGESLAPLYQKELESEGHEVLSASTCPDVLRLAERLTPDLIVLGSPLPGWQELDRFARLLVRHPWVLIRLGPSCAEGTEPSWNARVHLVRSANRRELFLQIRELLASSFGATPTALL